MKPFNIKHLTFIIFILALFIFGCSENEGITNAQLQSDNNIIIDSKLEFKFVYEGEIIEPDYTLIHYESHTNRLHIFSDSSFKSYHFDKITSFKIIK